MALLVNHSILYRIMRLSPKIRIFDQHLSDFRQKMLAIVRMNLIEPPFELRSLLIIFEADQLGESFATFGGVIDGVVFVVITVESVQNDPIAPVGSLQAL